MGKLGDFSGMPPHGSARYRASEALRSVQVHKSPTKIQGEVRGDGDFFSATIQTHGKLESRSIMSANACMSGGREVRQHGVWASKTA
jgi:hypothetical protein